MDNNAVINTISLINSRINSYEFLQAVRIIEGIDKSSIPVGTSFHPSQDIVKFSQNPGLKYYVSDITRCRLNTKKENIEVLTNFPGLIGTNSIMPFYLTEHILDQIRNKNLSMYDFLNLFHNRMTAFLYRAWVMNNQAVSYEKEKYDHFSRYIFSLIGHNYNQHNEKSSLHYNFKLYYAGHFLNIQQSKEGLISIIRDYFKVYADIEEFVEQWIRLPEKANFELGASGKTGQLGRSTFLGDKVWNCTSKFKIIIGPVSFERFNSLLPGTFGFRQLLEIVRLCSPQELEYDIQFILKSDEIPFADLSSNIQLGYNFWLITEKPESIQENFYIKDLQLYEY